VSYDPKKFGAKCDSCPIKCNPVPPRSASSSLAIIADQPGSAEENAGRPFAGHFGNHVRRALKATSTSAHLTSAILCKPDRVLTAKEEKKAMLACKPRLERELKRANIRTACAIGRQAFLSTVGIGEVKNWMGAPLEGMHGIQVIPMPWPGNAAMLPVFRLWINRAVHLNRGSLRPWKWPALPYDDPSTYALEDLKRPLDAIYEAKEPVAIDIETAGSDPLTAPILCIGFSNGQNTVTLWWPIQDPGLEKTARAILKELPTIAHNGMHDVVGLEAQGYAMDNYYFDTLLAHAIVAPQIAHDLGFASSCYFHMPRWKTAFKAHAKAKYKHTGLRAFTDGPRNELMFYNGKDAYMTAILYKKLKKSLQDTHNGQALFDDLMLYSRIAMRMKLHSVKIDLDKREEHRVELQKRVDVAREQFKALVNGKYRPGLNGQARCLSKLFFEDLGCPVITRSAETNQPSLDAQALQSRAAGVDAYASACARAILAIRKPYTLLATYVDGLDLKEKTYIQPEWKPWGTVTGRWSSKEPNFQNWPKKMRDMAVVRRPENWIVAADYSQMELRIVAALAQDPLLLEWYANNEDVHTITAKMLFNTGIVTKGQRNLAKAVEFSFNYNISTDVTTVWKKLAESYPKLTIWQLKGLRKKWFNAHPAIRHWQLAQIKLAESQGFIEEKLSGRREYFHGGHVDPNQVLNFPVQGFAGTLMNRALVALDKEIRWGEEGIIAQVHDAAYLEGPDPERLAGLLNKHMYQTISYEGFDIEFPIDVEIGKNLLELEPYGDTA